MRMGKMTRCLSALLAVSLLFAFSHSARPDGIPEPGVTLYGKVLAEDGSLVTQGRLVWTYASQRVGDSLRVTVSADLFPVVDDSGDTFSYIVHIPAQVPIEGAALAPNTLPATEDPVVYRREATVDGAFTSVVPDSAATVTFSLADCGTVERVDLVTGVNGPPDVPSCPSPENFQTLVPLNTLLDWADAARAETYDVYLWRASYTKPTVPTATGLTASEFQPPTLLRPDTDYIWQVVAYNTKGATEGPCWVFRTEFQGDLQKLLEYLLGKRYLTFSEQSSLDLNADKDLDVADFILGLKRTTYGPKLSLKTPTRDLAPLPADVSTTSPQVAAETTESGGLPVFPPLPAPLLEQVTVVVGSEWVKGSEPAAVTLPVSILPGVEDVAGMNFHIETDPEIITFVDVRPQNRNPGEEIYHYSPNPGILNVVFFANPVRTLQAPDTRVILLDLVVRPNRPWGYCRLRLTAAAISDTNGVSASEVLRVDGFVRFTGAESATRHWELFK